MKFNSLAAAFVLMFASVTQIGCGGRDQTVVQPSADVEFEDTSAEAAEENPEEYANMGNE